MKKVILILSVLFSCFVYASAQSGEVKKSAAELYIERYAEIAVEEMFRTGVPASITLAQGMLESTYGKSRLAVEGNNHFGIKCHSGWEGKTMKADDDRKDECFRAYDSVEESFRDHSDFLRYRDRYKFLFDLNPQDYKGWAYGLKQAGYATDPKYPEKLMALITRYDLDKYDRIEKKEIVEEDVAEEKVVEEKVVEEKVVEKKAKKEKKDVKERMLPVPPSQLETVTPVALEVGKELFAFNLYRQMYSKNGVPFVYSIEGETYSSIAEQYGLFRSEILRFNDIEEEEKLLPGTVVYIKQKKNEAVEGLDKYIVEDEVDLWEISQRFAVKLDKLYKMNGLDEESVLRTGDVILLREVKKEKKK